MKRALCIVALCLSGSVFGQSARYPVIGGATGATGASGPAGATGANGATGPAGATGPGGPTGPVGATGGGVTGVTAGTGLSGGTITTSGTISLTSPVAVANGGTNASTAAAARTSLSAAASGANADITSLATIGQTGITLIDAGPTNAVTLMAPSSVTASYNLALPPQQGTNGQILTADAMGNLQWGSAGISQASFNTYVANQITAKAPADSISFTNVALTGSPGVVNGYDFSFGGRLAVNGNTDPTENGLWNVNTGGAWTRDLSMSDNTFTCAGALVSIDNFGSTYANTLWFSTCDGSGAVHFVQIPITGSGAKVISAMGACTTGSSTPSTTAANLTCNGLPASASVAVNCSGSAAFSTATGNGLYCRASGSANTITCETILVNIQAMTLTCQWMQP